MILIVLLLIFFALTFPFWIAFFIFLWSLVSQVIDIVYEIFSYILGILGSIGNLIYQGSSDSIAYFAPYFIGSLIVVTFLLVVFDFVGQIIKGGNKKS